MMRGMVIDMNDEQLHTLAELRAFLDGTVAVDFAVAAAARYDFIARTVRRCRAWPPRSSWSAPLSSLAMSATSA